MKRMLIALSALALCATATVSVTAAADDPIAVRKALMQATAASAATSAGMMRNELDFDPRVARAALATFRAVGMAYADFFPEGSESGGNTSASPRIWEDHDGFLAAVAKFRDEATAAVQAAGSEGPADLAAFQAAVGPVLGNCSSCHQAYRVQN